MISSSARLARRTAILVTAIVLGAACSDGGGGAPAVATAPLADVELTAEGIGEVRLGATPEEALAALVPLLGGPSEDTDWLLTDVGIYGSCPLPLRVVAWGSLTAFFAGGPEDPHLFAYSFGFDFAESAAGVDPRGLSLATPSGVGLGTTVAALRAAEAGLELGGDESIDVWTFAIDGEADPHLRGQLTGVEDDDTVLFIETSTGCG